MPISVQQLVFWYVRTNELNTKWQRDRHKSYSNRVIENLSENVKEMQPSLVTCKEPGKPELHLKMHANRW